MNPTAQQFTDLLESMGKYAELGDNAIRLGYIVLGMVLVWFVLRPLINALIKRFAVQGENEASKDQFLLTAYATQSKSNDRLAASFEGMTAHQVEMTATQKSIADNLAINTKAIESAATTLTLLKLASDKNADQVDTIKLLTERVDVTTTHIDTTTTTSGAKLEDIEKLLNDILGIVSDMDALADRVAVRVASTTSAAMHDALKQTETHILAALENVAKMRKGDTGPLPAINISAVQEVKPIDSQVQQ